MKLSLLLFVAGTVSAFPFSFLFPNWLCDIALQVFHDVAPSQLAEASTYCSSFIRPTAKAVSTTTSTASVPGPVSTVATTTLVSTQTNTVVFTSTSTSTTGTSTSVVSTTTDLVSLRHASLMQGTTTAVVTITQTTTSGTSYYKRHQLQEPTLVARAPPPPGVWSKLAAADKSAGCSCVLLNHLPSPTTSFTSTLVISTTMTGSFTPLTATTSSVTTIQTTSTSVQIISVEATSTSTSTSTISTYAATTTSTQTATATVPSACPTQPMGPDFNSWASSGTYPDGYSTTGEWSVEPINGATYTAGDGGVTINLGDGTSFQTVDLWYSAVDEICAGQTLTVTFTACNPSTTETTQCTYTIVCTTTPGTDGKHVQGDINLAPGTCLDISVSFEYPYSHTTQLVFEFFASDSPATLVLQNFQGTASE